MYTPLTAELAGFARAVHSASFTINVDATSGYGATVVSVDVFPGGGASDPVPGPVCVPISGGWEIFGPNEGLPSGAEYLHSSAMTSSPRYQHTWRAPRSWTHVVKVEYQHGSSGTPPTTIGGQLEGMAIFAVYGGMRTDDRGWVGGLATPH